ncbi:AAA family ATPase [Fibrella sp. HMF5335]|uniref:AAA family ATPase n=1 Tax=Fibrella rubiginis TaxID=2817060 RepID=A0A939GNH2_9BACT|nr:AAA family ATPase [Fibrella rubiginis]MBO0939692.1 AAA family ATPase [Fibrella rubiginis]
MYIDKIEITNIGAIKHFEMTFSQHAGWHVLIGDNGAGKSSFIRAVSIRLVGDEVGALRVDWTNFAGNESGSSEVEVTLNDNLPTLKIGIAKYGLWTFYNDEHGVAQLFEEQSYRDTPTALFEKGDERLLRYYTAAFGPFRRFAGGSTGWENVYKSYPKAGAHLSAFGEDVALTEALTFIRELYIQKIDNKSDGRELAGIQQFVNESNLLQPGVIIEKIDSTGIFFCDANGNTVPATQLSDGYRSILSLTFEMFREMVRLFGAEKVFANIEKGKMIIDIEGVVLIDEADAHLHPTWQTRIGQWFVEHFPNIQFIVTTHSPLICRGAEKRGSIWRLAAPGSDEQSGEITGTQRDRLIYGNVLEAYGTEAFGEDVSQSQEGVKMGERLAYLNMRSFQGLITAEEEAELDKLKAKLPTAG